MSGSIVDISHVDFAYAAQPVLRDITLRVDEGSTLGLIGPNGGGKTTLVKLLMNLLTPAGGEVRIAGLSPAQAVRRGDVVGYLPQKPAVPSNFPINVRQLAQLGLVGKTGLFRSTSADDLKFVDELLDRVGASEMSDRPVGELSGGQLQRVLIARALAPRPRVLVLDEPTTGIDRAGHQRFIQSIADLQKLLGLTVIIVSHDLRAMSAMCDRIACLNASLHYHDVPHKLPADLLFNMFACDLQAVGISPPMAGDPSGQAGDVRVCGAACEHPSHDPAAMDEPPVMIGAATHGERS